jgi:acyl-CoA synthetase (AMP-forming)/AMP-acid ligase II
VPAGIATSRLSVDHGAAAVSFSPWPSPRTQRGAPPPVTADCAALILFTSGSTGEPVGVTLKHRHLTWTARALAAAFELDADHRELIVAPLAHSGAWQRAAATLVGGGCVAFWNGLPSVVGILEEIERLEVTGFFTAPPLLRTILAAPRGVVGRGLRRCRSIEIGSAAVSPTELRLLLELAPGARVFVHYGLTECSRAAILDVRAHPDKLDTVGRCLPGVEVAIRDAEGRDLPRGRRGRICLRGPQAAESYWARPELERNRRGDAWLETKDHGALDAEGFLKFLGREDDMINSGGYSFFPAEVEMEIGVVENVAQYVVAGVADPRGILEQVPWAFVVPVDAERWHPRDFLSIARERLPAHMIPRRVVCVAELPLTASGKPDRRRAVAMYFRTMEG